MSKRLSGGELTGLRALGVADVPQNPSSDAVSHETFRKNVVRRRKSILAVRMNEFSCLNKAMETGGKLEAD